VILAPTWVVSVIGGMAVNMPWCVTVVTLAKRSAGVSGKRQS
jgi:hypothetical protein